MMIINVLVVPWLAKIQRERRGRDVQAQQAEEVSTKQRKERSKEELTAGHKRQRRVAQIRDVDVLESSNEEEGAGVEW